MLIVITIGGAIALSVFATLDAFLWSNAGVADPNRLVFLKSRRGTESPVKELPPATFDYMRTHAPGLAAVGAFKNTVTSLDTGTEMVGAASMLATPEVFSAYGLVTRLGRVFTEEECAADSPVVVVSENFWRTHLGSAPDAIGREIRLNNRTRTVIGVFGAVPSAFDMVQIWLPLVFTARDRTDHTYATVRVVARLRAEVGMHQIEQELDQAAAALRKEFGSQVPQDWAIVVSTWREEQSSAIRPVQWLLAGTALLSVFVAGANAAGLRVVRFLGQESQLAIRHVLGASSATLVAPILIEGAVLAGGGAALAALAARQGLLSLQEEFGATAFLARQLEFGWRFHTAAVVFGVFFFACLTAVQTRRAMARSWAGRLQRQHASERNLRHLQRVVIAMQLGTAFMLASSGTRLIAGWNELSRIDLGFDASRATYALVTPASGAQFSREQMSALVARLDTAITTSGVGAHAAASTRVPLTASWMLPYLVHGEPAKRPSEMPRNASNLVSPGYLTALGLRLRQGRWFTDTDTLGAPLVAVVNQAFCRAHFPHGDAVGKWVYSSHSGWSWRLIVGVVDDVVQESLTAPRTPEIYEPLAQHPNSWFNLILAPAPGRPPPSFAELRAELSRIAPGMALHPLYRLQELQDRKLARHRFVAVVVLTAAGFAIILCLAGFASLVVYSTSRRTREFGLRVALGATPLNILGGVVRESAWLAGWGGALGIVGTLLLNQSMDKLVALPSDVHASSYLLAAAVLVIVTLAATVAPAWRASRVDPAVALREE